MQGGLESKQSPAGLPPLKRKGLVMCGSRLGCSPRVCRRPAGSQCPARNK